MKLQTAIDLYAGGPGSGCDPDAAKKKGNKCGRPPGKGAFKKVKVAPDARKKQEKLRESIVSIKERLKQKGARRIKGKDRRELKEIRKVFEREIKRLGQRRTKETSPPFIPKREHPKRYVKLTWKASDGTFDYTVLKPSTEKKAPKKMGPVTDRKHKLHGKFKMETNLQVNRPDIGDHRTSTAFEARPIGGKVGEGTTVFVHRKIGKGGGLVVQEFNLEEFAHISNAKTFKYKNFIKGQGFLRRRYGVSLKAPKVEVKSAAEKGIVRGLLGIAPEDLGDLVERIYQNRPEPFKFTQVLGHKVMVKYLSGLLKKFEV